MCCMDPVNLLEICGLHVLYIFLIRKTIGNFIFLPVRITKFLKFLNYLMEAFKIDLKTFLDLAMANQCFQTVRKEITSCFGVIIWSQDPLTFMIPIYI